MSFSSRITWLTALSLDAPLVSVAWQQAIASEYGIALQWHHRLLVFTSVWLGYSADRWFDAWKHAQNISQRHSFHANQRWPLLALWVAVLIGSITFALSVLESFEIQRGFSLAGLSIIATLAIQQDRLGRYRSGTKSLLTALLVTAAVILFALPSRTQDLLASSVLLTALFSFNCILIHHWDRPIDAKQENLDATPLRVYAIVIGVALILAIGWAQAEGSRLAPIALASAIILGALHFGGNRIHPETRRTLADIALLTPLLLAI